MARIYYGGDMLNAITPETAMKWFCWREIVNAMEKDRTALDAAIKEVPHNIPDWEMQVLKKFVGITKYDLIV